MYVNNTRKNLETAQIPPNVRAYIPEKKHDFFDKFISTYSLGEEWGSQILDEIMVVLKQMLPTY